MKDEVEELLSALTERGCDGARERMPAVLAAIRTPLDAAASRRLLNELRSQRCFFAMSTFATEAVKVADGSLLIDVKLQLAQAKIELGDLGEAIGLLDGL